MKFIRIPPFLSLALASVVLAACTQPNYTVEKVLRVNSIAHLKYGDYDPVRIQGRQPREFAVHGIDISRYNETIDWPRIKRAGVDFAFIKATEGKDNRDVRYSEHWQAARRAGIPRSAYHFYYFCATPEAQARNYINTVPKSDRSLPPILDVEWNPNSPTCTKRPSPRVVRDLLGRWLRIIEKHYGQKPIIYTTVDFHRENLAQGGLPNYQYWLRSVIAEPKYVYSKRDWTFWQYTGTGKIPGIKGKVDINAYKGSRDNWNKWLAANRR